MIAVLLLVWLIFIYADVEYNYKVIELDRERPNYLHNFIIRGMASILHGVFFYQIGIIEYFLVLIFQSSSFFVLFSPLLNMRRKKPFWYLGKNSGWIDRFLFDKPGFYKFVYFLTVVICVLSIVVIYKRGV